jgi:hypothetical protein
LRLPQPSVRAHIILVLLGLLSPGLSLSGQEQHLVDAQARLDWTGNDIVRVSIRYRVEPGDGPLEIPLAGLLFGGAKLSEVRTVLAGSTRAIDLSHSPGGRVTGSIPLSQVPRADEPISLELLYDVAQAGSASGGSDRVWRIPILAVTWPPVEARPETFTLEALIPTEYTLLESFPTGLRYGGENGRRTRYVTTVPVVPALVSLRVTEGERRMTVTGLLNVAVPILLFGGMSILGWRYLKKEEE